jgi:hypothetical protein
LRWAPVFHQAGCVAAALTEHAVLAHDRAHKHLLEKLTPGRIFMKRNLIAAAAVVAALTLPARANNIVDEWASIKAPAAPTLKPVTVDPKTTALLMLDFMNQNCGKRPRCLATIPAMKRLLDEARAHKVAVIYSIIANST